jgi:hypothetical protein
VQRAGRDYVFVESGSGFVPTEVTVAQRAGTEVHLTGVATGTRIASGGIATLKGVWFGLGPESR